jgi:hypothetical protein
VLSVAVEQHQRIVFLPRSVVQNRSNGGPFPPVFVVLYHGGTRFFGEMNGPIGAPVIDDQDVFRKLVCRKNDAPDPDFLVVRGNSDQNVGKRSVLLAEALLF